MATNADVTTHCKTQARSLLGQLNADFGTSEYPKVDEELIEKIFSDEKLVNEISTLEDYLKYYHGNTSANFHEFIMIVRIGIRIGALYEIEDHIKNEYYYY